jgi:microcystin-dependent protein
MKYILKSITALLLVLVATFSYAQVAVNTDGSSADASAMLDVKSTDKGVLVPRIQLDDKSTAAPVANPTEGLLVYNETGTEAKGYWYWSGTEWVQIQTSGNNGAGLIGSIISYAGISVPAGYLLCDGTAVSRTTYADLFAAIGTSWGAGDGSTTFNLPDLRGRFMRGVDNGSGNDPDAAGRTAEYTGGNTGDNVGSYQSDATAKNGLTATASESGDHSHAISTTTGGGFYAVTNGIGGSSPNPFTRTTPDGIHTHTITIGDGDEETRPLNAAVYYIIQY